MGLKKHKHRQEPFACNQFSGRMRSNPTKQNPLFVSDKVQFFNIRKQWGLRNNFGFDTNNKWKKRRMKKIVPLWSERERETTIWWVKKAIWLRVSEKTKTSECVCVCVMWVHELLCNEWIVLWSEKEKDNDNSQFGGSEERESQNHITKPYHKHPFSFLPMQQSYCQVPLIPLLLCLYN